MIKKRTGLLDIAKQVGVSKATVSRYLNTPDLVSPSLQKRISTVIETLGYLPNKVPNMLSHAKSHAIGVILPSVTNQIFTEVLQGIETITDQNNYQVMIAHTGRHKDKEEMRLRSLLSYNIDGLILTERNHSPASLKMIQLANIPVVEIMDCISPCIDMAVGYDNFKASKNMVERMIKTNKKNIVYLSSQLNERGTLRKEGYQAAMAEHNLETFTILSNEVTSYTLGEQLLTQVLNEYPQVDGIFCSNDSLALGVLFACQRRNIAIPQQIAIAGFHGYDIGQSVNPKLSSVLTPKFEMGKIAAEILLKRLNGKLISSNVVELPVQYIEGESIANYHG